MGNLLKKKAVERLQDSAPPVTHRYVVPNHLIPDDVDPWSHPNRGYHDNHIKTTKYTLLSFVPKNLFEQFHRAANIYFVFLVLLNWVPVVNAINKEIAMFPLLFVLSVTGIKDAFEDYRRYISDKTINHQCCRIYSKSKRKYERREWCEVKVGDIVHLSCNEVIPADMVLLRSSDEQGICHIDTANIDGENNLKQRNVIRGLKNQGSEFHPTLFTHTIECELPSLDIYKFHGALLTSLNEKIPVNNNNLLLRGCIVRNTDYIEAIVVYAGHETKALLNNRGPRYKRSKVERHINRDVLWCVILLFVMCFSCAYGSGSWLTQFRNSTEVMYIPYESIQQYSPVYQGLVRFWTFVILFQVMIPMSLYVTIEMVKLGQVYFIHHDIELYHEPSNKRVECRALNITEDLGQVQYVFSDKTGTLTENKMVFKRCTIGGKEYNSTPVTEGKLPDFLTSGPGGAKIHSDAIYLDANLQREVQKMSLMEDHVQLNLSPHTNMVHDFFLLLAVCNTVCVSTHEHFDLMDSSGNWPDAERSSRGGASGASTPTPTAPPSRPIDLTDVVSLDRYTRMPEPPQQQTPQAPREIPQPHYSHLRREFSGGGAGAVVSTSAPRSQINQHQNIGNLADTPTSSVVAKKARFTIPSCVPSLFSPGLVTGCIPDFTGGHDEGGMGMDDNSTEGASLMSETTLKTRYEAESPDELALVKAACSYGCRLVKRVLHRAFVWLPGEGTTAVDILHILPFDSFRKRMSVIIRHPITKEIVLLTKGADSNMLTCLRSAHNDPEQQELRQRTNTYLTDYAKLGLRTLCMAKRVLSPKEYTEWKLQHEVAENAMNHRERLLHQSACRIENNLTLLGATGIEDRLQEHVPETIEALREAGIRVWVLTGDKQETALNIAYSAKLFSFEQQLIILNAKNKDMAESLIRSKLEFIDSLMTQEKKRKQKALNKHHQTHHNPHTSTLPPSARRSPSPPISPNSTCSLNDQEAHAAPVGNAGITPSEGGGAGAEWGGTETETKTVHEQDIEFVEFTPSSSSEFPLLHPNVAMVIDGKTLGYALEGGDEVTDLFLQLASACNSVLCVRATPFQKAAMVKLVRDKLHKLTLAIGDGANDVSMIQTADLGVGLMGEEGMQAVMASDFALARFCFLKRLLLVHGHWCYDRLARMTLYMWYKNAIFVFILMWYQCFSGFSGGTLLDDFNLLFFNLIFTSLPPIMYGIFEKDVEAESLMKHPKLYRQGQANWVYKRHSYFLCIANALWQSLMAFFIPYFMYIGGSDGMWEFGFTVNTICVWTTVLLLGIETRSWGFFQASSLVISMLSYYVTNMLIAKLCLTCVHPAQPHWVVFHTFQDMRHWLAVIIAVMLSLLPHFIVRVVQGTLYPSPIMMQRCKDTKTHAGCMSATSIKTNLSRFDQLYYASWKCSGGAGGQTTDSRAQINRCSFESLADRAGTDSDLLHSSTIRHRRADSNGLNTSESDTII